MDIQSAKKVVLEFYAALQGAQASDIPEVLRRHMSPDYRWFGYHPFGEISGTEAVATAFWQPFTQAMSRVQRRQDVFFAGHNTLDGGKSLWVVSMGHLMGLFDAPWLGIRPTRKIAMLRYCEFNRIEGGLIAETAMYFDIPHLMRQAGQSPFSLQTGAFMVQPGPMTHDALLFGAQPAAEGLATMAAIEAMIGDLGTWHSGLSLEDELARTWHDDMIWWGPEGIGATYTIERYAKQHSGPFRAAFSERSKTQHIARLAEGHFGGFFGWPNFTATLSGSFMGMPPTGKRGEFRVIDIYRREGNKLAENWIFIDLLHFWHQQGVDLLKRATAIGG